MIHKEQKVAAGLRLIVVLFLSVYVMMMPVQALAQWDQLNREEQQQIVDQLKANLPNLLLTEEVRSDIESALSKGMVASQLAGEISKGDFSGAIKLTLDHGQGHLVESLKTEIDNAVLSMNLPDSVNGAYVYMKDHPEITKKVAIEMLQGEWDNAGKLVLDHANTELSAIAEANFKTAYNWVFGDRMIGSVSPADAFLYLVRAEIELIPKWSAQLKDRKLQEMFTFYRRYGWGELEAQGRDLGLGSVLGGGFGTWKISPNELKSLFDSCEKDRIAVCIADAKKKDQREKAALQKELRKTGKQRSEELNRGLDEVRRELNRLAAEQNTEFQSAFNEAQSIAKNISRIAGSAKIQCDTFEAQINKAEAALKKVTDAEAAVSTIQGFINKGEDCTSMDEDLAGLSADLERLEKLKTDFDTSLSQVEPAAREVCTASSAVSQASSKTVGRSSLDTAIQRARDLESLVNRVEGIVADIRSGNADMAAAVKVIKMQLEQLASSISDTTASEQAFDMIEAAKGAKQEFDAARSAMEKAVNIIDSLVNEFDQVNPVELSGMDRLDGLLSGGINRDEKRRIVKLLGKYRNYPGVGDILKIHSDALRVLSCADTVHRQWDDNASQYGRWSFRKWREPEIPANLSTDYQQALRQCADLPSSSEFDDIADQASQLTEDMEVREVELWVHKNDANQCIADALIAYENLPGEEPDSSDVGLLEKEAIEAVAALEGAVKELEEGCGNIDEEFARAEKSIDEALRIVQLLLDMPEEIAERKQSIEDDILQACNTIEEVQKTGLNAARVAKDSANSSRQKYEQVRQLLEICASAEDVSSVDQILSVADKARIEAAEQYTNAMEGLDLLELIGAAAKAGLVRLESVDDSLLSIGIYKKTLKNHVQNAEKSIAKVRRCNLQSAELTKKLNEVVAQHPLAASLEITAALRQRILLASKPEIEAASTKLESAKSLADSAKDKPLPALAEMSAMKKQLNACKDVDVEMYRTSVTLEAGQAIINLERFAQQRDEVADKKEECLASLGELGEDESLVEKAYVVVRVEGDGFTPHWAGASHKMGGFDQVVLVIKRGEDPKPRLAAYKQSIDSDLCEITSPPGFVWSRGRPMIWNTDPKVTQVTEPYIDPKNIDKSLLIDGWENRGEDERGLYELRKEKGCG